MIVKLGSEEEVRGVHARAHVATMENPKPRRDRAVMDLPTCAVRAEYAATLRASADLTIADRAVARGPYPTTRRIDSVLPFEAFVERFQERLLNPLSSYIEVVSTAAPALASAITSAIIPSIRPIDLSLTSLTFSCGSD